MKVILMILTFLGLVYGGFKVDQWLFYLIINEVPQTEWLGVIKIVCGIVLFLCTSGIILGISGFVTSIIGMFFPDKKSPFGHNGFN